LNVISLNTVHERVDLEIFTIKYGKEATEKNIDRRRLI
jgi:hypothetical protein